MMARDRGDGPDVVVYRKWLHQSKNLSSSNSSPLGEENCSTHGHDIVPNSTWVEGIRHETMDCMICERRITRSNNIGDVYCYCKNCSLSLHMDCALSGSKTVDYGEPSWNSNACKPCKEGVTDKSIECKACEFNIHIQYPDSQSPIAIKHFNTKEHFLTKIFSTDTEVHRCFACGEYGKSMDMYLCKDCGVTYDYECVTMPRRVKNVHGGHHHHLSLKFESDEAEDYLCQECQNLRDPALWYYSCEDCPGYELHPSCVAKLRAWDGFEFHMEWMDKAEIEAVNTFVHGVPTMKESESISYFYSRVIYLIQWYGDLRKEVEHVREILGSLPLKYYHIVVAIKRSKEYESMTVDQLMISLWVYAKRIDDGEELFIEQVLANLYATQWSSFIKVDDRKLIMNVKDVSLESILRIDCSKQESGDNWIKYWGKYWDNYWFNYQRGYYGKHTRQYRSKVQCSICKMFGHYPRHCWSVLNKPKKKPLKIKFLIQSHSSPAIFSSRSQIEGRGFKD